MDQYIILFITLSVGGLGTAIAAWITMSVKVAVLNTKLEATQKELDEEKVRNVVSKDAVTSRLDSILSKINKINVSLARINPEHEVE
jgi:hypothetical protein